MFYLNRKISLLCVALFVMLPFSGIAAQGNELLLFTTLGKITQRNDPVTIRTGYLRMNKPAFNELLKVVKTYFFTVENVDPNFDFPIVVLTPFPGVVHIGMIGGLQCSKTWPNDEFRCSLAGVLVDKIDRNKVVGSFEITLLKEEFESARIDSSPHSFSISLRKQGLYNVEEFDPSKFGKD